jgi:basement membrane-specific heparan sulfate proteoglycan core protein
LCESYQFQCLRSKQCISKAYVCDGQIDCQDSSDEQGCSQPTITRHPQRNIDACLGQTITITCEARGFPAPYINWRLNWGHIPPPPRCSYTTLNGYGILTITNAIYTDAGAYSCEALSTKGRVFAIDAIVSVRGKFFISR